MVCAAPRTAPSQEESEMTVKRVLLAWGAAAVVAALAFFAITAAIAEGAPGTMRYENAVRAAALQLRARHAECRSTPRPDAALCAARADSQWRKAMALAQASRLDTPAAWAVADKEIAAADARVRGIEKQPWRAGE